MDAWRLGGGRDIRGSGAHLVDHDRAGRSSFSADAALLRFPSRGRIGRGGRVLFDRVRCSPDSALEGPVVLGLGRAPPRRALTSTGRVAPPVVDRTRLAQIYSMSDSEDEDLKKTSVSHGPSSNATGTGSGSKFELYV